MTHYDIITVPHPALKQQAHAIDSITPDLQKQMDGMLETMYRANGIGLAANQVNILNRVIVMDLGERDQGTSKPIYMVNPEILTQSEDISAMDEGCLSIPQQVAEVQRPATIRVGYLDYNGQPKEMEASGLLSHCIQHEIDHLNGTLFIDYLSSLKRNMILKKVAKLTKQNRI